MLTTGTLLTPGCSTEGVVSYSVFIDKRTFLKSPLGSSSSTIIICRREGGREGGGEGERRGGREGGRRGGREEGREGGREEGGRGGEEGMEKGGG